MRTSEGTQSASLLTQLSAKLGRLDAVLGGGFHTVALDVVADRLAFALLGLLNVERTLLSREELVDAAAGRRALRGEQAEALVGAVGRVDGGEARVADRRGEVAEEDHEETAAGGDDRLGHLLAGVAGDERGAGGGAVEHAHHGALLHQVHAKEDELDALLLRLGGQQRPGALLVGRVLALAAGEGAHLGGERLHAAALQAGQPVVAGHEALRRVHVAAHEAHQHAGRLSERRAALDRVREERAAAGEVAQQRRVGVHAVVHLHVGARAAEGGHVEREAHELVVGVRRLDQPAALLVVAVAGHAGGEGAARGGQQHLAAAVQRRVVVLVHGGVHAVPEQREGAAGHARVRGEGDQRLWLTGLQQVGRHHRARPLEQQRCAGVGAVVHAHHVEPGLGVELGEGEQQLVLGAGDQPVAGGIVGGGTVAHLATLGRGQRACVAVGLRQTGVRGQEATQLVVRVRLEGDQHRAAAALHHRRQRRTGPLQQQSGVLRGTVIDANYIVVCFGIELNKFKLNTGRRTG
mmetsp:Transcript_13030/g.33249  ORF Transcript_13030/g.33249 Transcript_13030/m.33249 type:complete len:521 (+) Transcript_13030:187-1749(+)